VCDQHEADAPEDVDDADVAQGEAQQPERHHRGGDQERGREEWWERHHPLPVRQVDAPDRAPLPDYQ